MALSKYEAFVHIAQEGSFKKAAENLGYTQAGISYLMNSLEEELGTALFIRDHSGARLTTDGQNILPWVHDLCASEQALQTRITELRQLSEGSLRVASFASIAVQWLPEIMDEFLSLHPHIKYELEVFESQQEMEDATSRAAFDCCFLMEPTTSKLSLIPLAHDPIFAVVHPNHPLVAQGVFPLSAMESEPYIKVRSVDERTEFDTVFAERNVSPQVRFTMDNDQAVMGMIAKGFGFGLFPELVLASSPFSLAQLPLEQPAHRCLGIAVRSLSRASMATKAFISCVKTWVSTHNEHAIISSIEHVSH